MEGRGGRRDENPGSMMIEAAPEAKAAGDGERSKEVLEFVISVLKEERENGIQVYPNVPSRDVIVRGRKKREKG